MKPFQLYS